MGKFREVRRIVLVPCPDCYSTGRTLGGPCQTCAGTGQVERIVNEIVNEEEIKADV